MPGSMILGLALLVPTIALRMSSANRHVRGRLTVSAVAFAAYSLIAAALAWVRLSADLRAGLELLLPLLVAFGLITAAVALLVNPWRADRLPERFPNIVQDTMVIGLFAIVATVILQDRIFATTAVGAVVIGFALQDTLGNLFAGLAIQIEKPFRVGHWVRIAQVDGLVSEITWRATKVRTKAGNFVIVPNSTLSKDAITNYSEPTLETRIEVEVGATYDAAPNYVKTTILDALRDEPLILATRAPEVLLLDFGASAIVYKIRVWSTDFSADERVRDRVRSAVFYAFRRKGIAIPYPIQVQLSGDPAPSTSLDPSTVEPLLRRVEIFAALDDAVLVELARSTRTDLFAAGEVIVRQGEMGGSMFIVVRGAVVVSIDPGGREVARLDEGAYFGEMSLLTGAPRNATVHAGADSDLLEITLESFRTFVLANPGAVETISLSVAKRAAELDQLRSGGVATGSAEAPATFINRVRRFLGLSAP
jgi:small-conductance mechanosensitive channel/CRP-like cAMP-binding protein